jgi:hypothetical protein
MSKRRDKSRRPEPGGDAPADAAPVPAAPAPRGRHRLVLLLFVIWLATMAAFAAFFPRPTPLPASVIRNAPVIALGRRADDGLRVGRRLKGASLSSDPDAAVLRVRELPADAPADVDCLWMLRPVFTAPESPESDPEPSYDLIAFEGSPGWYPASPALIAQVEQVTADDERKPRGSPQP